MDVPFIEAVVK